MQLNESRDVFCWHDQNSIHIKNSSRLEKIILPKMFQGLTFDRFVERMGKYGFLPDKTCFLDGIMLRLKQLIRKSKHSKKDDEENQPLGVKPQQQALASSSKAQQRQLPPIQCDPGVSAAELREVEQYRGAVCDKLYAILDELNTIRQKHPDKTNELTSMSKYIQKMLEIGSQLKPKT